MRRILMTTLLAAATGSLCACAGVNEAVHGPKMTGMEATALAAEDHVSEIAATRQPTPRPASANSLWRSGSRAFFIDQRASRIGDILTVLVSISDSATTSNATVASRTGANSRRHHQSAGPGIDVGQAVARNLLTGQRGQHQVVARLARHRFGHPLRTDHPDHRRGGHQVLPNGNLMIEGRQEVKTNNDVRELTVAGIVRPEDITSANTVNHTQIAEARINYGGHGDISAVQKTPVGTALMQRYAPF